MRFYLPEFEKTHCLTGDTHTHAAYALRIHSGDYVTVFDGNGTEYNCVVLEVKRDRTELDIIDTKHNVGESKIDISLYLSVIKQDRYELAVQKATELGVNHIIPVYSAYTQRGGSLNYDRLFRIAVSACEQCGRSRVPEIQRSIEFDELVKRASSSYMIFPWERELTGDMRSAIDKNQKSYSVFIGPEGGITEAEKQSLTEVGAKSVTLGPRILRAETAAITALSVIAYEMGEWVL